MDNDTKQNLTEKSTWLRLVYIVIFAIAFNVTEALIAVVTIFQFLSKLITRNTNRNLRDFGQNLATYVYQIVLFLTFRSDERPFPFSPWPDGAPAADAEGKVPSKRGRGRSRQSDAGAGPDDTRQAPGTA